jgi:hypothetical protein
MSNTIGQFSHTVTKMGKADSLPFDPFVVINLQHWERETSSGSPIVSANLASEAEIDEHIRNLKADLDAVGQKAKRDLQNARSKTKEIVSARVG